jgi:hypothetical protein
MIRANPLRIAASATSGVPQSCKVFEQRGLQRISPPIGHRPYVENGSFFVVFGKIVLSSAPPVDRMIGRGFGAG